MELDFLHLWRVHTCFPHLTGPSVLGFPQQTQNSSRDCLLLTLPCHHEENIFLNKTMNSGQCLYAQGPGPRCVPFLNSQKLVFQMRKRTR